MAFGIGTNCEQTDSGVIRGKLIPISCECWYTVKGRSTPIMIKVQDENGEIQTIREIRIKSHASKNYSGVPTIEFDCDIAWRERLIEVKIIFFVLQNCWSMTLPWSETGGYPDDRTY
ncbi:hypothetical protein QMP26_41305 (plasmid) [Enterocloster clostridioformis]